MSETNANYFETPRAGVTLWTGMLAGPVLWFTNQQVNLVLVPWVCRTQQLWVLHLSAVVFLAGALAAGWLAWRNHRWLAEQPPAAEGTASRARFMAWVGLLLSALFALVIVAQAIPNFILDPCQR